MTQEMTGGCLLDGLTIYHGHELLSNRSSLPENLQNGYFPIQLVSLAQLVQAIVLNEGIVTDLSFLNSLRENKHFRVLTKAGLISDLKITETMRNDLQNYSGQEVIHLAKSQAFQGFAEELAGTTCEGAILAIASHYHGLEDPRLKLLRGVDTFREVDAVCQQVFYGWFDDGKSAISRVAALLSSGAFFYANLAVYLGIAYSPFCLRAPFCAYKDARTGYAPLASAKVALGIIRDEVEKSVRTAFGSNAPLFFQPDVPFVFGLVLARSKTRSDILSTALAFRNTPEATQLRKQMSELSSAMFKGDVNSIVSLVETLHATARTAVGTKAAIDVGKLKIGVAGFGLELPVKIPGWLATILPGRRRTTFYHLLTSELPTLQSISRDVFRIFHREAVFQVSTSS